MYYIIYLHICYIRISYIQFTKMLFDFGTFTNQTVSICYIKNSDMFESNNSTRFGHIYKSDCFDMLYQKFWYVWIKQFYSFWAHYKSDCSDMLYQKFWYVWIKQFYSFWAHLLIRLFWCIVSEILICLNQKILLVLGTFTNQTVPIY